MPKNILVIDDEENLRHMLRVVLEKAGYKVSSAADGREALSLTDQTPFDLILCDLRMPQMDGLTFLKEVSAREIESPVIMMSAYGTIDTAVEAMKSGAADYISKPFKPDEILLKLNQIEERNRLRRENIRLRHEVERTFSFQNIVAKHTVQLNKFRVVFRQCIDVFECKQVIINDEFKFGNNPGPDFFFPTRTPDYS